VSLSDSQEVRPKLLQLTARDAGERGIQHIEAENCAVVCESPK